MGQAVAVIHRARRRVRSLSCNDVCDKVTDAFQTTAMQSAAATAMQLFSQYKTSGKIEPTDMQKIMGVAMNLL